MTQTIHDTQLAQRAFRLNPTPSLSRSIAQLRKAGAREPDAIVAYDTEFHQCGWSSTWMVYALYANGVRTPVTVPAKFDPTFLLHAAFSSEERARAFIATLPL
jgi:hypothetical protein